MAQRPSFDMAKLSTADKILVGGSVILFIDSFFPWQTFCFLRLCGGSRIAWNGDGAFAGVLMAIFALLLVAATVTVSIGASLPITLPSTTVMGGLTAGVVLFGIIKFLFVLANHIKWGGWIGLILIVVVAYGGYMKMQEQRAIPPTQGFDPQVGP